MPPLDAALAAPLLHLASYVTLSQQLILCLYTALGFSLQSLLILARCFALLLMA